MKTKAAVIIGGVVSLLALQLPTANAEPVKVDEAIAKYEKTSGVSGSLNSIGSDTLNNVMALWGENFRKNYPNVQIQVEGKGSSTAPPALTENTAQLGPMSREMKPKEVDDFEKKFGYKPTAIRVAIDALGVFVHKDNPLKSITLQQLDSVFSSTFKAGGKSIDVWGDLGVKDGDWASKPISIYGRNSASGTYGFFKEHVLKGGDFKTTVKEQPGSSAVVQGIATDIGAIGYSGIGYLTSGVRALALSESGAGVEPSYEACLSGEYPLARFLYVYINKKPGTAPDPLVLEFLKYVLSQQGQQDVVADHYFPLPKQIVDEELGKLK